MLKMVDGTGIIGVDMICPLGVSTPQPPNYDRVELEGTGMLVLPNSLDAPLERLELGGKTEQVQTSGKNLFDPNNNYEDLVWIRNDGEIVGGSNARTSDYIPVEQGNYTFQFDVINYNQMFVAGYNTGKQFVKIVGTISKGKCIIKIDDIQIETIRLSYTRESTRIQLERSETQTPYEAYTGGKPSPSPEYPQEIKNSGKWNEETQKYEVDVKVTNAEQNWSKEQTLTLTSDRPITKWDRLVEQGGEIGWLYGTRDVIFTGDESWRMHTETDMSVWFVRYNCLPGIKTHNVAQNIGAYSNYALWERELANNRDGKFCTHGNPSNNFLLFGMSKDYTVETFKTWLREKNKSGKPMCLTYPTESTEFAPLPQSEQNAIRALKTYYPTTVITVDGGEVDPDIKVTYRKEI